MTDTHQPSIPSGCGVDAVAGQPPVPLSVWYHTGDPSNGRQALMDNIVEQYSHPDQHAVVINRTAYAYHPMTPNGRTYLTLRSLDQLDYLPTRVGLIAVGWSYASRCPSTADDLDDALGLFHDHLHDGGHVVVVFGDLSPGILHAADARPLITAAARIGLVYRQQIIHIHTGLRGEALDPIAFRPEPGGWPAGWHHLVHRYLVVLYAQAGGHD